MDFVCTSFPFRPNMICRYIVRRGREASNSKQKWYHLKDSLQQANCLPHWYSGHWLCQLAMKDHQGSSKKRNGPSTKSLECLELESFVSIFNLFTLVTHRLLNFTCVNWHQRYSINKRSSLAVECTAALGARASQSMEARSGHCWFQPRSSKIKKLGWPKKTAIEWC